MKYDNETIKYYIDIFEKISYALKRYSPNLVVPETLGELFCYINLNMFTLNSINLSYPISALFMPLDDQKQNKELFEFLCDTAAFSKTSDSEETSHDIQRYSINALTKISEKKFYGAF